MAGESPDRSKQRESSAEPTSGSASPVPEARSEAPPKRDPRLAVARDTERSTKRGGADTATRVLSTRTADKPTESPDAERAADAERDEDDAGTEATPTDAEQDTGDTDAADAEPDTDDADAAATSADTEQGVSGAGIERGSGQEDSGADAGPDDGDAERDESDAGVEGTVAEAERGADEADSAKDAEQDADEADSVTDSEQGSGDADADGTADAEQDADETDRAADAEPEAGDADAADTADAEQEADEADPVADAEPGESDAGAAGSADGASQEQEKGSGSGERGDDAAASDGRLRDAVAAWVATADQDEEPAAAEEADKDADKSSEDGQEATERAEEAAEADTDARKPEKPAEADADAREDREAEDADESEADRSATGGTGDSDAASESDDSDTDKGDAAPPVDQPTAVFKAVRPPVDQPTTMLKLGGATKDAPEKEAERTSKFVALKPLDDPSTRKPASGAQSGQAAPAGQATPPAPNPAPADATAPVPTVGPERTTQQPLPPRPPLDLLAELTNTPPPPDTPLRTAVRRVKIWTPLVLLLVVLIGVAQSVRPLPAPTLDLTAEESYTFEGGKVDIPWPAKGQAALDVQGIGSFGSSGEQKPVPIASVAKVMTAYVILRDHPLKSGEDGPKIEIDQAAEDQSDAGQESTVDVTKGDKISQREALESILIASANNVARLLARWDAGSEKAFVGKMNDAAEDLGMKNTTYTDPSGLNNTTVSTAVDQVKLGKAAMEQPAFREVAAMMSYVDYKGTKHDNWNRLVGYNDVTGIKTGTTTSALGNLVFSARKDVGGETRRIVGAVVRQPAGGPDNTILGAALYEGDKLIKAAQGALESATILKKGTVVGYADDGLGGRTPVAVTEDVTAVGWAGLSVKLTFAADELPHTAKAGTKVGTLTVGDGSANAVKVPVALQKDLVEPGFADKLTRLG
ncbi:D-alanyl-D-alanine carboxypeptidase [Streptomyces sp. NPDC006235]|uniref:D-alanyl-D-alanine carboxypeptidase n=1 Tax=Streptomyces sp. NPDC006235 TaxID=3156736 RepID=UPI0033B08144